MTSPYKLPDLSLLPSWANADMVSIDIETKDEDLRLLGPGSRRQGSHIVGISIAIPGWGVEYLPIRHGEGDNLDAQQVLRYFSDQAKHFKGKIIGANLSYDLDFLAEEGVLFPEARFLDVMIVDPLIYEMHSSYSLDSIARRWGLEGKDETVLRAAAESRKLNPKKHMWRLPGSVVEDYGRMDALLPLKIWERQREYVEKLELQQILDLEMSVLPVLGKMRRRGVRIDLDKLEQIENWSLREEQAALESVFAATGVRIAVGDVWKAGAIAPALEAIGVTVGVTPKTGKPSIKKDILAGLHHPVADAIASARKVNKLRTTFAQSIRNHLVNGRIHCTFNQMAREDEYSGGVKGARYGRMSCEHPNLQQQPARDEFAKMWRSIYIPEDDSLWGCLDFSQQEPRLLTHYAELCECPGASVAATRYREDPNTDNHQMMADLTGLPRKAAKNIFLGLCYGMGGAKLARELGLPTKFIEIRGRTVEVAGDEAQSILNQFDAKAPYVRSLAKQASYLAGRRGYIRTIHGRRCNFPRGSNGKYDWVHKALNRLIQGSAGDQTKKALVELDKAGYYLVLQVHDELDGCFGTKDEANAAGRVMEEAIPLSVPNKVDVEVGPNWGYIQ